jgi:CheY-like chemotaxis protein
VETILIVDDEPEVLGVAVDMLQGKGYTVLQTGDPLEALRIARTESGVIDLLLSDVVMPLMNGREMSEQIRAIRPAIKVLFMSAYSTDTIIAYGIRIARGQPFVMKPFRMEDLAAQVRAALDYRSPFGKRPGA